MSDIERLTDSELKDLSKKISQERSNRKKLRKKEIENKKRYSLVTPQETFSFHYQHFYREIMKLGEIESSLMEKIKKIEDDCKYKIPPKKEEIYPCPKCGELSQNHMQ